MRKSTGSKSPLDKEVADFLTAKRTRKQKRRRARLVEQSEERRRKEREVESTFGKRSKIIKMMSDAYPSVADVHKGIVDLKIPPAFSVIAEPESSLGVVVGFAKAIRQHRVRRITVDHSKLKSYDLAANGLLDLIAVELEQERRRTRQRIDWKGAYPADKHVRRFIKALGIVKHLGIRHELHKAGEAEALRVFDQRNRHYIQARRPEKADFKTKVVQKFADHVNQCLGDHHRQLTPDARHKLCVYSGEILDNAEQHADMVDWSIQGYLDNSLSIPVCEIAIFNFGKTIAETMQALPKDSYTWQQIAPYLVHHRSQRWFGPQWTENDLLTLVALQGHVSRMNFNPEDTRGNGTVDLIEFFQQVHAECSAESDVQATMAILSGGTHILFDGSYRLSQVSRGPRVIAFNAANDLNERPDHRYIRGLGRLHFPGTVISIRFPLSARSTVGK